MSGGERATLQGNVDYATEIFGSALTDLVENMEALDSRLEAVEARLSSAANGEQCRTPSVIPPGASDFRQWLQERKDSHIAAYQSNRIEANNIRADVYSFVLRRFDELSEPRPQAPMDGAGPPAG